MDRNKNGANGLYLFLALVISLSVWFFVDNFGNNGSAFSARQKVTEIPIEYTGTAALADRGLMLVADEGTTESIDLVFEGPRLTVVQLDRSVIRVSADLSSITAAGVQTVRYNSPSYLNDEGRATWEAQTKFSKISVYKRTPEYATVNIAELARKELDIRCELVGTVAEGYSAGQPQLSQSVVELQGMEEDVSAVSYAKVVLDLGEGAEDSVSAELPIQFYDANNNAVEPEGVNLSVRRVTATLPVYMTKTLPLKVNFGEAAGARLWNLTRKVNPSSVTVSGETSRLRNLDAITLGDLNLLDLVDGGKATYIYTIPIPDGCTNLSGTARATLEVSFKDMAVRQVRATHFQIDAELTEGRTAEVLTEGLTVSLFGTTQAVGAVEDADIVVTPDLSDYAGASGTYTVAAAVTLQNSGDVGVKGSYEVQVRIRDEDSGTSAGSETVGTAEAEQHTESGAGTGTAAEKPAGNSAGTGTGTGTAALKSAGSGAGTETETEKNTGSGAGTETEKTAENGAGTETDTTDEDSAGTETDTTVENGTGTETDKTAGDGVETGTERDDSTAENAHETSGNAGGAENAAPNGEGETV